MLQRMFRAALLDRALYKEVMADHRATGHAFLVVVLAGVATGVAFLDDKEETLGGPEAIPAWIVLSFIGWIVLTSVIYLAGTKMHATQATHPGWGTLARIVGFAHTPILLRALGVLPGQEIGILIPLVAIVWLFVAMVVASKEALDYQSPWRALGVTFIAFIPYLLVIIGLQLLLAEA